MGILIRCNDAEFTNYVGIADFPIIPQLKNLYYFGGTADLSKIDHSGNGNNGTFIGTEIVNAKSITFSGTGTANRMNAPIGTSGVTSVHAVALVKKSGGRGIYAAIASSTGGGFAFGTERSLYRDGGGEWVDARYTLANADGYYLLAWSITSTGIAVYRLNSAGELASITQKSGNALGSNNNRKTIGGTNYNWSMDGTVEIAAVAGYEGDVTTDQLKDALTFLKAYGEANGLTIA